MTNSNETNLGWLFYKDYYNVPENLALKILGKKLKDDPQKPEYDLVFENVLPTILEDEKISAKIRKKVDRFNDRPSTSDYKKVIIESYFDKKNQRITAYQIKDNEYLDLNFAQKVNLKIIAPGLVSGIGIAHAAGEKGEYKLGFEFDHTTGQPILPGSSVKGAARSIFPSQTVAAAQEEKNQLAREYLYYIAQQKEAYFNEAFGMAGAEMLKAEYRIFENVELSDDDITEDNKEFDGRKYTFWTIKQTIEKLNRLPSKKQPIFFDAYFNAFDLPLLGKDFITPHKQKSRANREMDQYAEPNPIQFLKILPETEIVFQFNNLNDTDLDLIKRILIDQGVGAKGNVGYGKLYDPSNTRGPSKTVDQIACPPTVAIQATTGRTNEVPETAPIVDENALPDESMNTKDYEKIKGKWQFTGKLKNGIILQATCLKKDPMNPKQKEFRIYIKENEQTVRCTYSDDNLIGKDCLIITKNVPKKSTKVVAIEFFKPLT